jgi:hypothetical protein
MALTRREFVKQTSAAAAGLVPAIKTRDFNFQSVSDAV